MALVFANRAWIFQNGTTTADSITNIVRGVDPAGLNDADYAAANIEMGCIEGISPNISLNKEDVYCAQGAGGFSASTASYQLESSPLLDSKTELVITLASVPPLIFQLFYGTTQLANDVAAQVGSGPKEIQGLVALKHHDSNAAAALRGTAHFWSEITLSGMNMDRAAAKPQLTISVLANGAASPLTVTGL